MEAWRQAENQRILVKPNEAGVHNWAGHDRVGGGKGAEIGAGVVDKQGRGAVAEVDDRRWFTLQGSVQGEVADLGQRCTGRAKEGEHR